MNRPVTVSPAPAPVSAGAPRVLGLRTRVLEAGRRDGDEAVVFIHGGPGSADDWSDLLPRLGAFARAIAFDLGVSVKRASAAGRPGSER